MNQEDGEMKSKIFAKHDSAKTAVCIVRRSDSTPYSGRIYIMQPWHVDRLATPEEIAADDFVLTGYSLHSRKEPCLTIQKDDPIEAWDMPAELWDAIKTSTEDYQLAILTAHINYMGGGEDNPWSPEVER